MIERTLLLIVILVVGGFVLITACYFLASAISAWADKLDQWTGKPWAKPGRSLERKEIVEGKRTIPTPQRPASIG